MLDERIYVSTGAFQTREIEEILRACITYGIGRVELSSGLTFRGDIVDVVRRFFRKGLRYVIHNYFPPHEDPFVLNLASNDPGTLARSYDHCRTSIELSAEFDGKFFSVHSGLAAEPRPEQLGGMLMGRRSVSYEEAYARFVQGVRELDSYAKSKGVMLLVENNVVAPFNLSEGRNKWLLMAEAEELLRLWRDVNSDNLGFLIDVGHVNVTAYTLGFDRLKFIERVAPYVVAFHLSENDGVVDGNLAFDQSAWFMPVVREFPDATMVIESYNLEPAQILGCIRAMRSVSA